MASGNGSFPYGRVARQQAGVENLGFSRRSGSDDTSPQLDLVIIYSIYRIFFLSLM